MVAEVSEDESHIKASEKLRLAMKDAIEVRLVDLHQQYRAKEIPLA